jgi:hypothetical protein
VPGHGVTTFLKTGNGGRSCLPADKPRPVCSTNKLPRGTWLGAAVPMALWIGSLGMSHQNVAPRTSHAPLLQQFTNGLRFDLYNIIHTIIPSVTGHIKYGTYNIFRGGRQDYRLQSHRLAVSHQSRRCGFRCHARWHKRQPSIYSTSNEPTRSSRRGHCTYLKR